MAKLYRLSDAGKDYWEFWKKADGDFLVHWGALGTEGDTKTVPSEPTLAVPTILQEEIDEMHAQGFAPISSEDHAILMIEFLVDGMGTAADVEKRRRLQQRMNETLGWTGLGDCDGGSIGSGTMEVCNYVIDFDLARQVIEADLVGTEFADYSRIYEELKE